MNCSDDADKGEDAVGEPVPRDPAGEPDVALGPRLDEAWRAIVRGPDRLGALILLLTFGTAASTVGTAGWALVSPLVGPSSLVGEPSVYLEALVGQCIVALAGAAWLITRRDAISWLDKS